MKARIFAELGEGKSRSEDFWIIRKAADGHVIAAVGDWASSMVGGPYIDQETARLRGEDPSTAYNGGVIGATLAKDVMHTSDLTGPALIERINARIASKYEELDIKGYVSDRAKSFTGYIAHARIGPDITTVTAVGDVRLAADGIIIAGTTKEIDKVNALKRKAYIERTQDIPGSDAYILPSIIGQYAYQNTRGTEYAYPAIDGTSTLTEGITVLSIPTPQHLLIWSDGFEPPEVFTIDGLRERFNDVCMQDPHRCGRFPAVRARRDDQTAMEILTGGDGLSVDVIGTNPRTS